MPQLAKSVYDANFFDDVAKRTRESAQVLTQLVYDLIKPDSVLDVGCATGTWLDEWSKAGVGDLQGIDGDYVDRSALVISEDTFRPVDLARPFDLGRKFDLVQTLEVAEHLDAASADGFVESLARHGDVIFFSAAIPGQGGDHHVNEQWPSYWASKFAAAGFTGYDVIRPQIWDDPRVLFFYRQNMMLFARGRVFDGAAPLDLVHPGMWENGQAYSYTLRKLPQAAKSTLRRKIERRRVTG